MSFWNRIENPGSEPTRSPASPAADPATARAEPARPEPTVPPARDTAVTQPLSVTPTPPARPDLRLGRGVRLEGKLTFSGTVRIDATFQGSIVTDGVLVVGEHAKVDADIACGTVIVDGQVNGNVVAKEAVELRSSARMRGDLEAPALTVERGAIFEGTSRRPAGAAASGGKAAAAPAPSAH